MEELKTINSRKELDLGESSQAAQKLPLKLEVKFDLKSFGGEINANKLNQWFKQMEVFFRVQNIEYDNDKIYVATLKLE